MRGRLQPKALTPRETAINYFDFHIGDYMAATSHLSMLEDAVYHRLMCLYYRTESPIPADLKQAARLVRAQTKAERAAVQQVLIEFFELQDDGWHNSRCDAEIEAYRATEPEREAKKANESNRLRLHREERARLFKALTDAGHHAPWNCGMGELRALVANLPKSPAAAAQDATPATAPETFLPPAPATAPATAATATQYPPPNTHYPEEKKEEIQLPREHAKPKPGKPGKPALSSAADLVADGLDQELAAGFIDYRKTVIRQPLTSMAWGLIKTEAAKAGVTPTEAVSEIVSRGWRGFKAEWMQAPQRANAGRQQQRQGAAERDAEAIRLLGFAPAAGHDVIEG